MDKKTRILGYILSVAMLMIMIPVLLQLLLVKWAGFNYVFAAGAVATLVVRIMDNYTGTNLRIKRLYRIATVSAICYCVSAYLKFSAEMHFFPTRRDTTGSDSSWQEPPCKSTRLLSSTMSNGRSCAMKR